MDKEKWWWWVSGPDEARVGVAIHTARLDGSGGHNPSHAQRQGADLLAEDASRLIDWTSGHEARAFFISSSSVEKDAEGPIPMLFYNFK